MNERYSLRQILYETPRRTELFIVLTMYNVSISLTRSDFVLFLFFWGKLTRGRLRVVQEDEVLFCRTMHGVMSEFPKLSFRSKPFFPLSSRCRKRVIERVLILVKASRSQKTFNISANATDRKPGEQTGGRKVRFLLSPPLPSFFPSFLD